MEIRKCLNKDIKFISSMGTAKKLDIKKLDIIEIIICQKIYVYIYKDGKLNKREIEFYENNNFINLQDEQ